MKKRPGLTEDGIRSLFVSPDEGAHYDGGLMKLTSRDSPMVVSRDLMRESHRIRQMELTNEIGDENDIAYAGSCSR